MAGIEPVRDEVRGAMARRDYERAQSLLRLLRERYPRDFESEGLLGQIHLENHRYGAARNAFASVLEVDPENVLARSALAIIAEEVGDPEAALSQFHRAFDVNPSNTALGEEIRRLRSEVGRDRREEPVVSEHAVARRLLAEKRYVEASSLFEDALRMAPNEETAVGLARALWLAGHPRAAESRARLILADHPNCLAALAIAAGAAFARGSHDSFSLLKRAAELNPGNPVARAVFKEAALPFPSAGEMDDVFEFNLESLGEAVSPGSPLDQGPGSPDVGAIRSKEEGLAAESRSGERVSHRAGEMDAAVTPGARDREGPSAEGDTDEGETRILRFPRAEFEGEWVRERARKVAEVGRVGDAALHLSFATSFMRRGQDDLAIDEYRKALHLDASTAAVIREAVGTMVSTDPTNVKARWLVGDTLVAEGQFRQAVEQYTAVLTEAVPEE